MMMSNKHLFSGVLAVGVFCLAFYYRHEVMAALYGIQISWAIAGFICILSNYYFRALRLNVLAGNKLPVWPQGIYCTSVHGFANYMLPLRSGDLSLPFLLKSICNMELKDGATVLYKARLLEVFTLGIWFVAASLFPSSKLPSSIMITMVVSGILMILSPFLLKKFFNLSLLPFKVFQRVAKNLAQTSKMNLLEIMLTCGIWISIAMSIWCITAAIQLPISVIDIVFLIALQLVMQLMPVQGFANSGNHESGWVAALVLMGCPADMALKFALTSHAIILVYVLLIGLIALILRHTSIR
ncbi:MAG: flippase-like domain-containing protein [Desulfosarcina sp.]|nr:flippase-like domain-containing protein [Desulfosarcina sp.]